MSTSLKENNKPLLVGLTGGIGSGKSTIAAIFTTLGIPVFNADIVAKELMHTNAKVKEQVIEQFGDLYPEGVLDRAALAKIVFNDEQKRDQLNQIVHPAVGEAFQAWIAANNESSILVKEAAILFETGLYKELDKIILVTCDQEERIKRVIKRDNTSREEVLSRMASQWIDDQKIPLADFQVDTTSEMIIPQALKIIEQIKSLTM